MSDKIFWLSTLALVFSFAIPIALMLVTLAHGEIEMSLTIGGLLVVQMFAVAWASRREQYRK